MSESSFLVEEIILYLIGPHFFALAPCAYVTSGSKSENTVGEVD